MKRQLERGHFDAQHWILEDCEAGCIQRLLVHAQQS